MFYETTNVDRALRFGDVLQGFVACTPRINDPLRASNNYAYHIEVSAHPFFVVLSPCCSIANKVISLVPLISLRASLFNNPYFVEDLTRINRPISPGDSLPPQAWTTMSPEEKAEKLSAKPGYVFYECFVYEKHDLFPEYTIPRKEGNISTKYYMVDFRHTFRVNSDKVNSPENAPLQTKCLQLSIDTRKDLREKISYYYSRVPKEDLTSIS